MHHSDPSGETPGTRRMSHPSGFTGRRGSNTCGAPVDEPQTPAGSSSPGPHHPPHSLGVHPQAQSIGAQVKKKSGFQITSVLPAQVSASGNNSIADDTESYDDMDESHTEDLSSSDILDVSVSRATDTGVPDRSSSEETLNSLHGGETPGVVSPNEPVMHHGQPGYMVNGVHHHAHHHHSHHKAAQRPPTAPSSSPVTQGKVTGGRAAQAAVAEGGGALPAVPVAAPDAAGLPVTVPQATLPSTAATQTTAAFTASRFRVVKLDSNSEPFRKGRWTCTEFYEKDAPPGDSAAAHRTVENIILSEQESTSGSSSGSTLSGGGGDGPPPQHHAQESSVNLQVTGVLGTDRAQPPMVYAVEGQSPPVQSCYPIRPPVSVALQPLQIPSAQSAVSPRAAPVPMGIPGLPVTQPVSPRPQLSSSSASGPQPLLHGAVIQGQQVGRFLPAGVMSGVTASQLEDAQRLLLQHHPLLSLPRLTGSTAADGGADAAFTVTGGVDEDSSSGASVVAIDNKIEQAMDLVKSHLMYAVREEVEVLKEQIKELIERNLQLEQENTLLKNLASPEQLAQFQVQVQTGSPTAGPPAVLPQNQGSGPTA